MQFIESLKFHLCVLFLCTLHLLHATYGTEAPPSPKPMPTTNTSTDVADICGMSLVSFSDSDDHKLVKCECDALSVDVDCSHLGITKLPQLISFPKGIQIANFKGNKIPDLKSDTFYNARGLLELDMSHNHIDFISYDTFKAFKNLMRLDLSHNRIWNLPTKIFQGLASLKRLDLSYNDLINVFPDLFAELTNLRELILESNPIQSLEPKHFEHLQKLEVLDLEATLLKVIPDHVFYFTPKLVVLKLANNLLSEVPTEALKVLDHLKVLDLSGNPLKIIGPEAFKGMRGLVMLYLDRMPALTKIDKYAFGDLTHLQELHCSYNYLLSEIDEKAFVKKTDNSKVNPAQLFLRQNDLYTLSKELLDWNNNMELHIRENPLICDCKIDWMVHLKVKNDFQKHARCVSPSYLEGSALSDLKDQELTCSLELSEIVMIVCAVLAGLLILAMIVAFLVWRRNYTGYRKPYFPVSKKRNIEDVDYRGDDSI